MAPVAGGSSRGYLAAARRGTRGFTLVELMITVAIAAILMMIAVPSFRSITISNKLTTAANGIVDALNATRMAAIKRNANAQMCSDLSSNNTSDTLGGACNTSTQPAAVYVLAPTTTGTSEVQGPETDINGPIQLSGNIAAVRFWPDGLARTIGTETPQSGTIADICSSQISSDNHRIIKMSAGSIITTEKKTATCP